jgi:cell envelope opacity-associated protein A
VLYGSEKKSTSAYQKKHIWFSFDEGDGKQQAKSKTKTQSPQMHRPALLWISPLSSFMIPDPNPRSQTCPPTHPPTHPHACMQKTREQHAKCVTQPQPTSSMQECTNSRCTTRPRGCTDFQLFHSSNHLLRDLQENHALIRGLISGMMME